MPEKNLEKYIKNLLEKVALIFCWENSYLHHFRQQDRKVH